jgi:hypothetical protein
VGKTRVSRSLEIHVETAPAVDYIAIASAAVASEGNAVAG